MKNWWYSLSMLAGYVGIFHLWMHVPRPAIIASGAIWCVLFGALAVKHRSYFLNKQKASAIKRGSKSQFARQHGTGGVQVAASPLSPG